MSELIDDREKARAACIELMQAGLERSPEAVFLFDRVYSAAEVITELKNMTPVGERFVDMYIRDQAKRNKIEESVSKTYVDRAGHIVKRIKNALGGLLGK